MDREARDPYELMEEIEQELGIETCPVNWPIGSGKRFAGVYERNDQEVVRFIPVDGGKKEVETEILKADDPKLKEYVEYVSLYILKITYVFDLRPLYSHQ